jgi:hypothetical protein
VPYAGDKANGEWRIVLASSCSVAIRQPSQKLTVRDQSPTSPNRIPTGQSRNFVHAGPGRMPHSAWPLCQSGPTRTPGLHIILQKLHMQFILIISNSIPLFS